MTLLILVVDDEPDIEPLFRQRFRQDLRTGRFTMDFAPGAERALEIVVGSEAVSLILVLSDINMPGMSGLDLLPRVKAARPDVPVIMVTAYGDDERRQTARAFGAAEFVTKPVDFDLLKQQLQQLRTAS